MLIEKVPVVAETYGGYLNLSQAGLDWTVPGILDIVINDLAGSTRSRPRTPPPSRSKRQPPPAQPGSAPPRPPRRSQPASGLRRPAVFTATAGNGRVIAVAAPDMLGLIGPLFAPVNPQNAQSTGFTAGRVRHRRRRLDQRDPDLHLVADLDRRHADPVHRGSRDLRGPRQPADVTEPSVLGMQVAYYGYFTPLVMSAAGIIKLTSA